MHRLIRQLLLRKFDNPLLRELADSASIDYRERIAFTTDSFVVNPIFFPGGDIGKLAVCGTVNDLVMVGARPEYLSLGLIIEEGLETALLERISDSLARTAKKAGVRFVTGDIKVVQKGACDRIFINTSGIGKILKGKKLSLKNIAPGDKIIITGSIARHGLAVMSERNSLNLQIKSDCACLNSLVLPVLKRTSGIKFMRDPTRGGLATTLNEITQQSGLGIIIEDKKIPLEVKAAAACELLGIDPFYVACEGAAVLIVEKNSASRVRDLLRKHPLGRKAELIGSVNKDLPGKVVLETRLGTRRIIDMMMGDPLPRIC